MSRQTVIALWLVTSLFYANLSEAEAESNDEMSHRLRIKASPGCLRPGSEDNNLNRYFELQINQTQTDHLRSINQDRQLSTLLYPGKLHLLCLIPFLHSISYQILHPSTPLGSSSKRWNWNGLWHGIKLTKGNTSCPLRFFPALFHPALLQFYLKERLYMHPRSERVCHHLQQ